MLPRHKTAYQDLGALSHPLRVRYRDAFGQREMALNASDRAIERWRVCVCCSLVLVVGIGIIVIVIVCSQ
jgi:hypothetical protein